MLPPRNYGKRGGWARSPMRIECREFRGLSVRIGGRLCSSIVVKKTIRPSISSSGPRYGPNFGQAQYDVPHVLNRKGLETATLISPTSPAALIGKPRWLPPLAGCPSRHRRTKLSVLFPIFFLSLSIHFVSWRIGCWFFRTRFRSKSEAIVNCSWPRSLPL